MQSLRSEFLSLSFIACLSLMSAAASADPSPSESAVQIIDTQIFDLEEPMSADSPYTALSTSNGRVYTVTPSNQEMVEKLRAMSESHSPVHLGISGDEIVSAVEMSAEEAFHYADPIIGTPNAQLAAYADPDRIHALAPAPSVDPALAPFPAPIAEFQLKQGYLPTFLKSMDEAHELFLSERPLSHGSQCHERAMVWAHDMFKTRGIYSMKVMMFYTQRFRNEFRHKSTDIFGGEKYDIYKWWYHTAPLVYVGDQPVVLDSEFLDKEVTLDDWTHYFLHDTIVPNNRYIPYSNVSHRELTRQETQCRVISNFREYAVPTLRDENSNDWCMVRIFPMYYMQPVDVARMDCDPAKDPNYTRGLTGEGRFRPALGGQVLTERLNDGRFKYACSPILLNSFRKEDLETAYRNASPR